MYVPFRKRMWSIVAYLGLAPFIHYLIPSSNNQDEFSYKHCVQAQALLSLLLVLAFLYLILIVSLSFALVNWRGFYEKTPFAFYMVEGWSKLLLSWSVFWGFSVLLALFGSTREVLLVSWISRMPRWLGVTRVIVFTIYGLFFLIFLFSLHANHYVRPHNDVQPKAVMLFDNMDIYPRSVFAMGFYPIARASASRWGAGYVDVQPFTIQNLYKARMGAHFIFLATHGTSKGLYMDVGMISPDFVSSMPYSNSLQYVYITGCDSGTQQEQWEQAFSPAQVITFDRLSAIVEHIWWLWMRGPKIIQTLPDVLPNPLPENLPIHEY